MDTEKEDEIIRRNAEKWNTQYLSKQGKVWGDNPSPTLNYLVSSEEFKNIEYKHGRLKILDIGAGYGRDTKKFAEKNHFAVGFELANSALSKASPSLKNHIPLNIQWLSGDFLSDNKFKDNEFDVVFSHRTLHLLTEQTLVQNFVKEIYRITKNEGIICISARDLRDFNPKQMEWVDGKSNIARYTISNRQNHIISFWSKDK